MSRAGTGCNSSSSASATTPPTGRASCKPSFWTLGGSWTTRTALRHGQRASHERGGDGRPLSNSSGHNPLEDSLSTAPRHGLVLPHGSVVLCDRGACSGSSDQRRSVCDLSRKRSDYMTWIVVLAWVLGVSFVQYAPVIALVALVTMQLGCVLMALFDRGPYR